MSEEYDAEGLLDRLEMAIDVEASRAVDVWEDADISAGVIENGELFINSNLLYQLTLRIADINASMGDPQVSYGSETVHQAVLSLIKSVDGRLNTLHVEDIIGHE